MTETVKKTQRDRIFILTLHNPPVNGLSAAVRAELLEGIEIAENSDEIDGMVLIGTGNMFCAGADIREFGTAKAAVEPRLPSLIQRIEDSKKPVVAAIHGVAAGGGLELALGCHARIALKDARVGLPEVTLGIIPGAGGTQRLPRLVGAKAALETIVSGKLVPASSTEGVFDESLEPDQAAMLELQLAAIDLAKRLASRGAPKRTADREFVVDDPQVFDTFRKSIARKSRGFDAPFAAIEVIEKGATSSFLEGIAYERQTFEKLVGSGQAAALRHVFFAERQLNKIPGLDRSLEPRSIERVAVIGFGTMGGGIAMAFANAGLSVAAIETSKDALDNGMDRVRRNYQSSVSKGRMTQVEMDQCMSRIVPHLDDAPLADAQLVVEAVFEDMDVKKEVFARLDKACPKRCILATNTSTLDIDEIAASTSRPEDVVGTHFFSPAHIMRLMENVRGNKTSDEVVASVMALSKRLNKVGVLVGVCDGFVGNRMLYGYRRQADFLIEEGALPQDVDRVMVEFGLPMGPFAMADLAGLDIGWSVRKRQADSRPKHLRYSPIADRICELGRFGQKTGAGWYRYEDGSRTPLPDPEIDKLILSTSKELGIERREIGDEEILKRCLYPLINEGAKILKEGLALRSSDIDIVWIYGYGFPRYRGGPMFYADQIGLQSVHQEMMEFHREQGEWMEPAPLLAELAESGKSFGDWRPT